jgi:hypothetical protein
MTTTGTPDAGPDATGAPSPAAAVASAVESALDIKKVISGSTSDVPVAELSRKGLKKVKVLNQNVITKLIVEAVDRVISERSRSIGREEREKVIQESGREFEKMARERVQRERDRIGELEKANESLLKEAEELRARIGERDEEVGRLKAAGPSSDRFAAAILEKISSLGGGQAGEVTSLQKSLQAIAEKLDRLPRGGGSSDTLPPVDEKALVDALFRLDGPAADASNIGKIKIKEAKAGGVKDTLAKLKALQKGGNDGD